MTGNCYDYQDCECRDQYYQSGDECKSMSNSSFIIH